MPPKPSDPKPKIKITIKCKHDYVCIWMSDQGWAPIIEQRCKKCGHTRIHDTMEDILTSDGVQK